MHFIENPLKKGPKRVKIITEKEIEEELSMIDLTGVIKKMAKILYDREHLKKKDPIYAFDKM